MGTWSFWTSLSQACLWASVSRLLGCRYSTHAKAAYTSSTLDIGGINHYNQNIILCLKYNFRVNIICANSWRRKSIKMPSLLTNSHPSLKCWFFERCGITWGSIQIILERFCSRFLNSWYAAWTHGRDNAASITLSFNRSSLTQQFKALQRS